MEKRGFELRRITVSRKKYRSEKIMETTADFSRMARNCEKNLLWVEALYFWRMALKVFPNIPGELADQHRDQIITAINADMETIDSERS